MVKELIITAYIADLPQVALYHFLSGGEMPTFSEFEIAERRLDHAGNLVLTVDADAYLAEYPEGEMSADDRLGDEIDRITEELFANDGKC